MDIFYKDEFVTLINDDCFNVMNRMKKQNFKVDIILTSPPYNTTSRTGATDAYNKRYDGHFDNMSKEEYADWTVKVFNCYDDVLKENGVVLYNVSYSSENTDGIWITIGEIISKTNFTVADTIIWKKKSAIPNNRSKNKLTRICEYVFVFARKNEIKTFISNKQVVSIIEKTQQNNYENLFNFVEAKNNDGSNDLNKATYSSELCKKLLSMYATENSTVYDSFMGTGTTAVACKEMNLKSIGSELSKEQCEFSKLRIQSMNLESR